ncbi:superoxide dismutase family protein [Steroidobacter sp.]|uniref:superoxide dismutase family protein n=1 Tax=Steroidobacter sp. TaxID=1978227 RepID=UPI001A3F5EDF|nr:superoxide dismutase family protein [Steroidobacter sp.]MBL8267935.1 superoxide dismutase family protein [Steroidobacter sp.]
MKSFIWIPIALLIAACGRNEDGASVATTSAPQTTATAEATAGGAVQLSPTKGNTANGGLNVSAAGSGVKLSGMIQGLKPDSEFGFHFHEKGDCSAPDATSAGAHFNPTDHDHGNPQAQPHHAGDMLNVKSDAQGVAEVSIDNPEVSLQTGQPNDILGKALVVHAKPDDYQTQPSGDSGDRIACGVVAIQTN